MKAIADTGFLVAFGNRNDTHHEWALGIAGRVTEPLLTCEAVLAETAFHLGSSSLILALLRDGLVRTALVVGEHLSRLAELAARYADRKPDLADLCLIRLSELHLRYPVITAAPTLSPGCSTSRATQRPQALGACSDRPASRVSVFRSHRNRENLRAATLCPTST